MVQQHGDQPEPEPIEMVSIGNDGRPRPASDPVRASDMAPGAVGDVAAGSVPAGEAQETAAGSPPGSAGETATGSTPGAGRETAPDPAASTAHHADSDPAPAEPHPPGAPRTRVRRIVLLGLLVVALAMVIAFSVVGIRILQQKDATLAVPDRAAGLTRDDSAAATDTADNLRAVLAAAVSLDDTQGAVYNDPANATRSVLFFGGTGLLFTPDAELDKVFELLNDHAGSVSNVHEVPAGDLGGVMKCGSLATEPDMAVCAWADHGSVGVTMFPGRSADESAPLMRSLRNAIQAR